jgi:hypothetical protein
LEGVPVRPYIVWETELHENSSWILAQESYPSNFWVVFYFYYCMSSPTMLRVVIIDVVYGYIPSVILGDVHYVAQSRGSGFDKPPALRSRVL